MQFFQKYHSWLNSMAMPCNQRRDQLTYTFSEPVSFDSTPANPTCDSAPPRWLSTSGSSLLMLLTNLVTPRSGKRSLAASFADRRLIKLGGLLSSYEGRALSECFDQPVDCAISFPALARYMRAAGMQAANTPMFSSTTVHIAMG